MYYTTESSSPSTATLKLIPQANGSRRCALNKSSLLKDGSEPNRPISNGLSVRATSRLSLVNGISHHWFQYILKSFNARIILERPLGVSAYGITQRLTNCHT